MRRLTAGLFVYLLLIFLFSALLTPPVFQVVEHWAHGRVPVRRVFDRTVLVAALFLVWPLFRYLKIAPAQIFGTGARGGEVGRFGTWFAAGIFSVLLLYGGQAVAGVLDWRPDGFHGLRVLGFLASALAVAAIEESLFRGAFFLAFTGRERTRNLGLILVNSLFFATVHFLKAQDPQGALSAWTGFEIWREMLAHLLHPQEFVMRWVSLFLAGAILCVLALRYGRLWAAAGMHAGWVLALKACNQLTDSHAAAGSWWFSGDVLSGLWPDLVLGALLLGLLLVACRERSLGDPA